MRTYIFTAKERQTIRSFLNGTGPRDDPILMTTLSRIRGFKDLASDVELYLRLREAITTGATKPSLKA